MYRTVALAFLRAGAEVSAESAAALLPGVQLDVRYEGGTMHMLLGGEDVTDELARPEVGQGASDVQVACGTRRYERSGELLTLARREFSVSFATGKEPIVRSCLNLVRSRQCGD